MQYINFNGSIYPEQEPLLPVTNRGIRYGDGFFESMVMFNKKIPLLEYHFSRIEFTAEVIAATLPSKFDVAKFQSMVLDLASVNNAGINARIRLQFYRKGDGLYLPDKNELGYIISMDEISASKFEVGNGLVAGMRDDCYKTVSMVSDLKNSGALMYVLAAQFAKAEGWDECILTNQHAQICEGLASNIFLVKGDKLITPNLDSGCVNGVMRSYLMWLTEGNLDERDIDVSELMQADEILLTNAVKGIQWVRELEGKIFDNKKATELTALINSKLMIV